jgi:hypothetical protein
LAAILDPSFLRWASREKGTLDYRLFRRIPCSGFALLPPERLHHCLYRIEGSHALLFAFSPSFTRRSANPAAPSARPVNWCAASRCRRVEFKWFETVDMRNNADADRLDRPDRSRYLGKKSPFRDAPITVVGLMEGLIVDG